MLGSQPAGPGCTTLSSAADPQSQEFSLLDERDIFFPS